MDEKLINCKFIKTVLLLLVILYHSCVYWTGGWIEPSPIFQSLGLSIFSKWLNSFHIYTFTFVSGYIFYYKISSGEYTEYTSFLVNKFRRLIIPYLFTMIIWVAPISAYFFKWDKLYIFSKYLLCIDPSQLWFLWMLFGVFAISWLLKSVIINHPVMGWIIALIFYGLGVIGSRFIPNYYCIWTAFQYMPFFTLGIRIGKKDEKGLKDIIRQIPFWLWIIMDIILFVGTMYIHTQEGLMWKIGSVVLSLLLHMIGVIMAWNTLNFIADYVPWKNNRVFARLVNYAMPMYLFHQQIIFFTCVWLNGKIYPCIHAVINFFTSITISFLISAFLMRWRVTKKLIGEK